jgi:hypothetical protein
MKKCPRRAHGTVMVGLLLGLLAPGVGRTEPVPNLTGTWEGKYTCKVLQNGVPIKFTNMDSVGTPISILKITHTATALNAGLDAGFHYAGFAAAQVNDSTKGAATFVECSTTPASNAYNEMLSVTVNTKPAHATLKGIDVYNLSNLSDQEIGGICRYNYKRVDTADPGIGPCP